MTLKDLHNPQSVAVFEENIYWTSSLDHIGERKGVIQAANRHHLRAPVMLGPELPDVPTAMLLYHPLMQLPRTLVSAYKYIFKNYC